MSPTFSQSSSEFGTSSALTLKLGSMDLRQELRHLILTAPLIVAPHYQCMRGCPFAWYFVISWWAIVTYVSLLTIRLSIFARLTSNLETYRDFSTYFPLFASNHCHYFRFSTLFDNVISFAVDSTRFRGFNLSRYSTFDLFRLSPDSRPALIPRMVCSTHHHQTTSGMRINSFTILLILWLSLLWRLWISTPASTHWKMGGWTVP